MDDVLDRDDDCDMHDAGGAPLYSRNAERAVLGALLLTPALSPDLVALVGSSDFFEPLHANLFRVFERIAEGGDVSSDQYLQAFGGDPDAVIFEGRTAQQYLGYLRSIGFDAEMAPEDAAQIVQERAELRATGGAMEIEWHEPIASTMGLKLWEDQNDPSSEQYEYIVEDLIPERQGVILMGETQTGKSFLGYHMGMCMARAVPFFGRRILEPIGVVWLAYEASTGAGARMRAYSRYHGLEVEPLPFAVLTKPLPLWPNDLGGAQPQDPRDQVKHKTATDKVIAEIEVIQEDFRKRFKVTKFVVLIDTQNAATPGASEIDSEVVSKIRGQFHQIITELGATLIVVGHTSDGTGKLRGNQQLTNNFDTVLKVSRKTYLDKREVVQVRDGDRREVRTMKVVKQREGIDTASHDFVLHVVEDGTRNRFGNPRTSCVVTAPTPKAGEERDDSRTPMPKGYVALRGREAQVWSAFVAVLKAKGTPPPLDVRAKPGQLGIALADWREELARNLDEVDEKERATRAKSRIGNFIQKWGNRLVRSDNAFYWRTKLKVDGIDPPPEPELPTNDWGFDASDFPPN